MEKLLQQIEDNYFAFRVDAKAQLEKGNKAAAIRARKAALALINDFKEYRILSLEK